MRMPLAVGLLVVGALVTASAQSVFVPTPPSAQTRRVPDGYASIQGALNAAEPGDTVQIAPGTYRESVLAWRNGTPNARILIQCAPGVLIEPREAGEKSTVALGGAYTSLDGCEIADGQHGITISASQVTVTRSHIHDNWDRGDDYGQGILVVSASNILIAENLIERNGLLGNSPAHLHGIYVSNFDVARTANITIRDNVIRSHGGAGIHLYHPHAFVRHAVIAGNTLSDNVVDLLLVGVREGVVEGNQVDHASHPATNAEDQQILWLERNRDVVIRDNTFRYADDRLNTAIVRYDGQDMTEIRWRRNTWELPPPFGFVSDRYLNELGR